MIVSLSRDQFVSHFQSKVYKAGIGITSLPFEAFVSSPLKFRGHVDRNGFRVILRKKFSKKYSNAVATGTFSERNRNLKVDVRIKGYNPIVLPLSIILGFINLIVLREVYFINAHSEVRIMMIASMFLMDALLLLLICRSFYLSVRRLSREIETEINKLKARD